MDRTSRSYKFERMDPASAGERILGCASGGEHSPWLHDGHAFAWGEYVLLHAPTDVKQFLLSRQLCSRHMKANTTWHFEDRERQLASKDRRQQRKAATTQPVTDAPLKMNTRGECESHSPLARAHLARTLPISGASGACKPVVSCVGGVCCFN